MEIEYSVADTIEKGAIKSDNSTEITEIVDIPKKKLSNFCFWMNILVMLYSCNVSPYYIFAPL
jgi:hypothetical protein